MKRLLAFMLIMLLTVSACAEGDVFTLRNGITWGMSPDEVLAAEGNPKHELDDQDDDGVQTLELKGVTHGGAKCDIEYEFLYDALFLATIEYDTEEADVTFEQIEAAMTKSFGEPGAFSDAIKSLLSDEDLSELDAVSSWALKDGTHVWLMEDAREHSIEIMLVDLSE